MNRAALQERKVKTARSTLAGAKPTPSLRLEFGDVVGATAPCKVEVSIPLRSKMSRMRGFFPRGPRPGVCETDRAV